MEEAKEQEPESSEAPSSDLEDGSVQDGGSTAPAAGEVPADGAGAEGGEDFLDFENVQLEGVVSVATDVPPATDTIWHDVFEYSLVILLLVFFFGSVVVIRKLLPIAGKHKYISHKDFPPGVQRGVVYSAALYGITFIIGFGSAIYHMNLNEGMHNYFRDMGFGKFLGVTHAHIFGLTTSFLIVGIPFTMKYSKNKIYQWFLPLGLTMVFVDVFGWWGVRYIGARFELISNVAGITFGALYLVMLVGLIVRFRDIKIDMEFEEEDVPFW